MSDNGTPCFDPTCPCCSSFSERCRDYETEIEGLRARLVGPGTPDFKGATYRRGVDGKRLGGQFERIWAIMRDGEYHTIAEVAEKTGDPAQSVGRQIRYIRSKPRGSHVLEREYRGNGLYAFRVDFDAVTDQAQIKMFG